MKYFIVGIALVVLLLMSLIWNRNVDSSLHSFATDSNSVAELKTNEMVLTSKPTTQSNKSQTLPGVINSITGPLKQHQKEVAAVAAMNVPVKLWAKVVDQYGTPLSGVKVQMSLRQWKGEGPTGVFPVFVRETDPQGFFDLGNQKGDVLEFKSVQKEGYRLSPKALTALNFERNSTPSSSNSPVIFRMWKLQNPEQLISGNKFFGIIPDGRAYTIDLVKGTKTEGERNDGDLRVKIVRTPVIQEGAPYDWTCDVETTGGGLLATDDDFMYSAPETGYASPYQVKFAASQPSWSDCVKNNFYIRSRGGSIYGQAHVEIFANYNGKSVFSINYSINPNGSRNLQSE